MVPAVTTAIQGIALVLASLLAGSVFGIWRGYDPTGFSPATFLEAHQGAVRGLNVLLPTMGALLLALILALAYLGRGRPAAFWLYVATIVGVVVGGVVTRVFNQSINAEIMTWTAGAMPADWAMVRDTWWHWHVVRTFITIGAEIVLIAAIFVDRSD